ncbi:hypothetical protein PH586_11685 [Pseudomonas sp. SA3-5]|uniref:DUF3955 domain-containing protein n=1 Tax=Pseudomonas aestuarii TaxID=3018340 RepID=A0ABT4XFV7_9PSED|nr:hypothetical protein [Pseudomonas aestuarii]MDA7087046.1 hypothetical protein [Pseudomonas aestuarii]
MDGTSKILLFFLAAGVLLAIYFGIGMRLHEDPIFKISYDEMAGIIPLVGMIAAAILAGVCALLLGYRMLRR